MMILLSLIFPQRCGRLLSPKRTLGRPGCWDAQKFASVRAAPHTSADDLVTFFNLLVDRPSHVRERRPEATQEILQAAESRSLTGKWSLLDDVFVKILSGSLDIAVVEHIIDKLTNQVGVVFHLEGNACRLLLVRYRVNRL
jgi:hypothetical protein